jgi:hypothetical protein
MRLNTYQSGNRPDLFVTCSSVEAACLIAVVEGLSALDLNLVRADYAMPDDLRDSCFLELVSTAIARDGYAVHGFEPAVGRSSPSDGRALTHRTFPPGLPSSSFHR